MKPRADLLAAVHLSSVDLELLVGDPENDVPGHQAREARHEALVERGRALLHHHARGAVLDALVLAGGAVHVTSLHHVDGTRGQGGAEPRCHRGRYVTGYSVAEVAAVQDVVLDDVVANDLRHVHDRVPRDVRNGS